MKYIDTPEFDRWAKRRQEDMLAGIFQQAKDRIVDWDEEVALPIGSGDKRWREFRVILKSFRVMAQYTAPFGDEDPRFAGVATKNRQPVAFSAPGGNADVELGDTYSLDMEVMHIADLDIVPYSAELVVRAFDRPEPLTELLLDEFATTATATLAGVTASIPYGGTARRVGNAVLENIVRLAGSPKQIGSHYTLFDVPNRSFWRRDDNVHFWQRYKFVAFVEEDPDDEDTPYEEIYMTLWELQLLSAEAMTGERGSRVADGQKTKRDDKKNGEGKRRKAKEGAEEAEEPGKPR